MKIGNCDACSDNAEIIGSCDGCPGELVFQAPELLQMILARFSAVATRIDLINVGAVSRAWHAGARLLLRSLTFTITAQHVTSGDHVTRLRRLANIRNARIELVAGTYNFSGVHGNPEQCKPSGNRGDPDDYVTFAELDENDRRWRAPMMDEDESELEQSKRLFLPRADEIRDTEEDSDGNWLPEWTWKPGFGPLSIAAGVTIEAARARALRSDGPLRAVGGPYQDVTIAHVNQNGEALSEEDLKSFQRLRIDQPGVRLVGVNILGGCDVSKRADLNAFCCAIGPRYEVDVTDEFDVCFNAISVQGTLTATRCDLNGAANTSVEVGKTAVVDVHSCVLFYGDAYSDHGVSGIAGDSNPYAQQRRSDIPDTATVNRTPIARKMTSWCHNEHYCTWEGWACRICNRDLKGYKGTLRVFHNYDDSEKVSVRVCAVCWVEPKGDDDWYKFFDAEPDIKSDFDIMLVKVAEAHLSSEWENIKSHHRTYLQEAPRDWFTDARKKAEVKYILRRFAKDREVTAKHDEQSRICDCYWCMNVRCADTGCIRCHPL